MKNYLKKQLRFRKFNFGYFGLSSGFTMIELLVVIVILGILSAIGLGAFTAAQEKSRDSSRKSSLNGIATSLEVYYNDAGSYPLSDATGGIVGCDDGGGGLEACVAGEIWQDNHGSTYMVQLPADPKNNGFFYVSNGTQYQLYARLENIHDSSVPLSGSDPGEYSVPGTSACGGSGCNYGVASSNTTLGSVVAD